MASNLTNQVREIADVTTAVANGDLSRKIHVHAQGEILELQQTINSMVDQLRTFAFEVTRVSREVGIDGILGGQAEIREVLLLFLRYFQGAYNSLQIIGEGNMARAYR